MNECIFLGYILLVAGAALCALKLGKEALIALICVQCVLVNLFVTKEIELFGFTATASDALGVGAALSLNLLQEYFGKPIVQKTIWISFLSVVFYIFATVLHVNFIPATTDFSQTHFVALLSPMPRIVFASIFVYLITQYLDSYLYGYLRNKLQNRYFILRNYSSIALTQLVDTILFSFLGLYMLNESFSTLSIIVDIIIVSYMIKLAVLLIAAPFLSLSQRIIATPH